jgi:hypothetical protein
MLSSVAYSRHSTVFLYHLALGYRVEELGRFRGGEEADRLVRIFLC